MIDLSREDENEDEDEDMNLPIGPDLTNEVSDLEEENSFFIFIIQLLSFSPSKDKAEEPTTPRSSRSTRRKG